MAASLVGMIPAGGARAQSLQDLQQMSIDELASLPVSSVTKTAEPLSDAPAAIYLITRDDILRSGARTIPEMLRLAPNLEVFETSASRYVITARGFSGNSQAQAFSNKLLVLIDGRSVYTPLFSGVYWDMQDVPAEDIERIEVISGPGATLWGANAVNGVINIITRPAADTPGARIEAGAGDRERGLTLQYGGNAGGTLSYRLYAKAFRQDETVTAAGAPGGDGWTRPQAGFRLDWTPSQTDRASLQGDLYHGNEHQLGAPDEEISGGNLLARWNHAWRGGGGLQVQGYFDRASRDTEGPGGGAFWVDAYDLDVQQSFEQLGRHQIVVGGGVRVSDYHIRPAIGPASSLAFAPGRRTLRLANAFAQDSIRITNATTLILGLKLEDDPYSGLAVLPSARGSWNVTDNAMLWAAVSRAVRSPTPFDRDVVERLGPILALAGNPDFRPETLTAYEAGARIQPSSRTSFSVSAYYNVYDDLRSIEVSPVTGFFPLTWGNGMRGHTYGLEAWGDYKPTDWWRLSAGLSLQHQDLGFKAGASGILGVAQAGDDPKAQASLRSSMTLGPKVTLDADLRYVGALPDPHVPSYVEMNGRLGWSLTDRIELSMSGFNLLHDRHQEFPTPANAVPRSVYGELRLRF